jgi:ketosteroid isomerase-like protein
LLAALVAGCGRMSAPSAPAEPSAAADEAAIDDFDRRYLGAINDGDVATLASLTTDNHMMISGSRSPLAGKQALVDTMARAFAAFDIDETWSPEETMVSGDLAYRRGTWVVVATPKAGGDASRTTGSFVRIYRRQPDGAWYMVRDILSTDAPRD